MAYAAFAKVDPRLLAQNFGGDKSASIAAAGKAVADISDSIIAAKDKKKKDAKETEDRKWTDFKRTTEVQEVYDKWSKKVELNVAGVSADPPSFPGYTIEGGRAIKTAEANNLADGLTGNRKERRKKRNKRRIARGKDTLSYKEGDVKFDAEGQEIVDVPKATEATEEKVDGPLEMIYSKLNEKVPGSYDQRYKSVEQAEAALEAAAVANANLGEKVVPAIAKIVDSPLFDGDSPQNAAIVSLHTAASAQPPGVHSVYNHKTRTVDYVWQDAGSGETMTLSSNNVTELSLNGGKAVTLATTNENVIEKLLVNANSKVAMELLQSASLTGKFIPGLEAAKGTIHTETAQYLTDTPGALESYIRTSGIKKAITDGDFVDPTPNSGITAEDAASFTLGTIQKDQRFAGAFTNKKVVKEVKVKPINVANVLQDIDSDINVNFNNRNVAFFESKGYKEVRFDEEGNMTHLIKTQKEGDTDGELLYTEAGTPLMVSERVTVANTASGRNDIGLNVINSDYTGKDKAALLGSNTEAGQAFGGAEAQDNKTLSRINPTLKEGQTIVGGKLLDKNNVIIGNAPKAISLRQTLIEYKVKSVTKLPFEVQDAIITRDIDNGTIADKAGLLALYEVGDVTELPKYLQQKYYTSKFKK